MKKSSKVLGLLMLGLFIFVGCGNNKEATKIEESKPNDELTLYIIRHGKTMLNTTDRVQGWSDAILTPEGEEVVTAAGKGLKNIEFQSAYSSDSGRAMQTANLILTENTKSSDILLQTDPQLREFNFGTYEGDLNHTMWSDIAKNQGITVEEFMENMTPKSFADSVAALEKGKNEEGVNWPAEDFETITTRLTKSIDEIVEKESKNIKGGNILIVSHGLSISALLDTMFDEFEMPKGGLKNASVSIVKVKNGEYTLENINDTSYIEKGQK